MRQSSFLPADIRLEIQGAENDLLSHNGLSLPDNVYHPRNALLAAIKEWIPEFAKQKTVR